MIVLGVIGLLLVVCCAGALDDTPRDDTASGDSRMVGALIFLLCLAGIVSAHAKRKREQDDD